LLIEELFKLRFPNVTGGASVPFFAINANFDETIQGFAVVIGLTSKY
jgi:hypothetical protein